MSANAKQRLDSAVAVLKNLEAEGYDVEALANAPADCDPEKFRLTIGPAHKFWDELPKTSNGLRVLMHEDFITVLDKDTLVAKTPQGFKVV